MIEFTALPCMVFCTKQKEIYLQEHIVSCFFIQLRELSAHFISFHGLLLRSTKKNAYYLGLDAMRFQGLGAILVGLDQIASILYSYRSWHGN